MEFTSYFSRPCLVERLWNSTVYHQAITDKQNWLWWHIFGLFFHILSFSSWAFGYHLKPDWVWFTKHLRSSLLVLCNFNLYVIHRVTPVYLASWVPCCSTHPPSLVEHSKYSWSTLSQHRGSRPFQNKSPNIQWSVTNCWCLSWLLPFSVIYINSGYLLQSSSWWSLTTLTVIDSHLRLLSVLTLSG